MLKGGYIIMDLSKWSGDDTTPQTIKGSYKNAKDCLNSGVLVLVQASDGVFPASVEKNGNNYYVVKYTSTDGDVECSISPQDRVQ